MISKGGRHKWSLLVGDALLSMLASVSVAWLRGHDASEVVRLLPGGALASCLYITSMYVLGLYNLDRLYHLKEIPLRAGVAVGTAGVLAGFMFFSMPYIRYGRGTLLPQTLLVFCLATVWRLVVAEVLLRRGSKNDAVVVGTGDYAHAVCEAASKATSPYRIVAFLETMDPVGEQTYSYLAYDRGTDTHGRVSIPTNWALTQTQRPQLHATAIVEPETETHTFAAHATDDLALTAKRMGVSTVILAVKQELPLKMLSEIVNARFRGLTVLDGTAVYEKLSGRVPVKHIGAGWLLSADGFQLISRQNIQRAKRLGDLVLASTLLAITLPAWCLIWIAIRLESAGPAFFKQPRIGRYGSVFTIWKFRSMCEDAEPNGPQWAQNGDTRVTRVGRWLRKLRLDELPQLINVIRGDMSLIGPRPERPEFVASLTREIPHYALRHSVIPGITGWAQINFSYGASVADAETKLEYDLFYIKNMSMLLDIRIGLRTIGVILFPRGVH